MFLSILPIQSVKDPSMHAGIGYNTRVTKATKGFNFQIIDSLLESMGLRFTVTYSLTIKLSFKPFQASLKPQEYSAGN